MPTPREKVTPNAAAFIEIRGGRTQKEMALLCEVSLRTWAKLEAGELVSYRIIAQATERLGWPIEKLIVRAAEVLQIPQVTESKSEQVPAGEIASAEGGQAAIGGQAHFAPKTSENEPVPDVLAEGGQAHFAPRTPQNEPVPGGWNRRNVFVGLATVAAALLISCSVFLSIPREQSLLEPQLVDTTSDYLADWKERMVHNRKHQSRTVYRRNSPNGLGHDLWCNGDIQVTNVAIRKGAIKKLLHAARDNENATAAAQDEVDGKLSVAIDFRAVSTGSRRLFVGPGLLSTIGLGRLIDPEQNGSKVELYFEWKDVPSTGQVIVDIDYCAIGGKIVRSEMRFMERVNGDERADKFTREVLIPQRLTPFVVEVFSSTGIRVSAASLDRERHRLQVDRVGSDHDGKFARLDDELLVDVPKREAVGRDVERHRAGFGRL
jgi:hypothetical protein